MKREVYSVVQIDDKIKVMTGSKLASERKRIAEEYKRDVKDYQESKKNAGKSNGNISKPVQKKIKVLKASCKSKREADEYVATLRKEGKDAESQRDAIEVSKNAEARKSWLAERQKANDSQKGHGNPTYTEYLGMLYTEAELVVVKKYIAEHGGASIWDVGDRYIKELIDKGVLEKASHDDHGALRSASPEGGTDLYYKVRYVSKGGLVNERLGWINVKTLDPKLLGPLPGGAFLPDGSHTDESFTGKYWAVSALTRMAGILGVP
jgi:hypothetical protein